MERMRISLLPSIKGSRPSHSSSSGVSSRNATTAKRCSGVTINDPPITVVKAVSHKATLFAANPGMRPSSARDNLVRFIQQNELYRKKFAQFFFVEANDELVTYINHRHAHLTAFLDHLLTLGEIGRDIVIRKLNLVGAEKIFRHMAKVACRGRIDGNFFLCGHICIF